MKKIFMALLVLGLLTGCSQAPKEEKQPIYTYVDKTPGLMKQYPMKSLNYDLKGVNDLNAEADLVMIAKVTEIKETKFEDKRFKTPHQLEAIETMKGHAMETIDMDGGRMTFLQYKNQSIQGEIPQSFVAEMSEKDLKEKGFAMMPANFYDLETGQTYLFFVKDGEILNEGYGVFEKLDDKTYQNVISKEKININDIK